MSQRALIFFKKTKPFSLSILAERSRIFMRAQRCSFSTIFNVRSQITPTLEEKQKVRIFEDWIRKEAKVSNNVVVDWRAGVDALWTRGVFANGNIRKGDRIISIPKSLVIDQKRIYELEQLESIFPPLSELGSEFQYIPLAFYLIYESSLFDKSKFYPWIQALPTVYHGIHSLTSEQRGLLDGEAFGVFRNLEHQVLVFFEKCEYIANVLRDVFPESTFKHSNFQWALSVIMTRCFTLFAGKPMLVPFVDFFNQADPVSRVNVTVHKDAAFVDNIAVSATRDIESGEELLIDYGHKSNSSLLACYGFIKRTPDDNPIVTLKSQVPSDQKELIKYLETSNLLTNSFLDPKTNTIHFAIPFTHVNRVPANLLPIVRVLALNRKDFQRKNLEEDRKLIHEIIIPQLREILKMYKTTLKQDDIDLEKYVHHNFNRDIVAMRKFEKLTILNAIKKLTEEAENKPQTKQNVQGVAKQLKTRKRRILRVKKIEEEKQGGEGTEEKPNEEKPNEEKSNEEKSNEEKSNEEKPSEEKPNEEKSNIEK